MNQSQFKAGDVVVLKSGGPKMSVAQVNEHAVLCTWFQNGQHEQKYIAAEALTYPNDDQTWPLADITKVSAVRSWNSRLLCLQRFHT